MRRREGESVWKREKEREERWERKGRGRGRRRGGGRDSPLEYSKPWEIVSMPCFFTIS